MTRVPMKAAAVLLAAIAAPALAAGGPSHGHGKNASSTATPPKAESSITHGVVTVEGHRIRYEAKTGILILKNLKGKPIASMSYVAYIKSGVSNSADRPITFFYNGGPGSSTIWLHMLAYGPKRVVAGNGTLTPPAPYKLVNNHYSLLDATDEVFVDAPGTGFGRVIGKDEGGVGKPKDVFGIDPDAKAFTQFITQYLTQNNRWNSPKFLYGESYGTTRSAVLAGDLQGRSVDLNGIILQSSILSFDLSVDDPRSNPGVNSSYATGFPTYAATAWYHHKVPNEPKALGPFLKKVEAFSMGEYLTALNEGNLISADMKRKVAEQMHAYTGLPVAYILKADLKVTGGEFAHELLGASGDVTGRLDSRYSGPAMDPMSERAYYDPLDSAIDSPTVSVFNDYVRNTLHFGKDRVYRPEIYGSMHWSWKHHGESGTPNVMNDLARAMKRNPNMKILLTGGYFDLGTPFYAAEYEMHQLPIPEKLQKNISYDFFRSGHMVYLNPTSLQRIHDASAKFIEENYKAQ